MAPEIFIEVLWSAAGVPVAGPLSGTRMVPGRKEEWMRVVLTCILLSFLFFFLRREK